MLAMNEHYIETIHHVTATKYMGFSPGRVDLVLTLVL